MAEQQWNVSLDGCQVILNHGEIGDHDYLNVKQEDAERFPNEFKWTHHLILLLIEKRSAMNDQFNGARRKKRLWEKVSEAIKETSGVLVGGDKCDEKWRNLVASYRRIKDKLGDSDGENVTWEYFHMFDNILQNKPCSAPLPNMLSVEPANADSNEPPEDPTTEERLKWKTNLILLLIEKRSAMNDQFNATRRKKRLWEKVSEAIEETSGVHVGGDKCDEKWRNLVASYKRIKDKLGDSDEETVPWEFFHMLDNIFQNKPWSAPVPNRLETSCVPVEPAHANEPPEESATTCSSPTEDCKPPSTHFQETRTKLGLTSSEN